MGTAFEETKAFIKLKLKKEEPPKIIILLKLTFWKK